MENKDLNLVENASNSKISWQKPEVTVLSVKDNTLGAATNPSSDGTTGFS